MLVPNLKMQTLSMSYNNNIPIPQTAATPYITTNVTPLSTIPLAPVLFGMTVEALAAPEDTKEVVEVLTAAADPEAAEVADLRLEVAPAITAPVVPVAEAEVMPAEEEGLAEPLFELAVPEEEVATATPPAASFSIPAVIVTGKKVMSSYESKSLVAAT